MKTIPAEFREGFEIRILDLAVPAPCWKHFLPKNHARRKVLIVFKKGETVLAEFTLS